MKHLESDLLKIVHVSAWQDCEINSIRSECLKKKVSPHQAELIRYRRNFSLVLERIRSMRQLRQLKTQPAKN
jgi:hypothetical protein